MSAAPKVSEVAVTPVQKWTAEMQAADRFFDDFHKQGRKVIERYVDDRKEDSTPWPTSRLNLFHANITTLLALMYSKLPKVEADRRFADPNDDVARVAGEMATRCLQNDLNMPDCALGPVLKYSLFDRLVPGMGIARLTYGYEEDKDNVVAEVEGGDPLYAKKDEWVDETYVHWRDVRWSPARTYEELRWIAFRSYMSREEVVERFGEDKSRQVSYTSKGPAMLMEGAAKTPVEIDRQAEIWEIWDKDAKVVHWWALGATELLDEKPDPLHLEGFFPCGRPMVANVSTDRYMPKADFVIAQDIYNRIDQLETRIGLLTDSCKAVGIYAGDAEAVKNMLQEGIENQLIPVDNWAMWAEKGGLKGTIEWFPIKDIAEVLGILTQQQQLWIQKLYQVTGMSDIMRGQASAAGTTATEQKIKAQFGSVRINALQEEFAAFASDLLNKKWQIIRRFYEPERIIQLSNIANTPDAQYIPAAIQLIKSPDEFDMRVIIRSESMAAVDMDSLKAERNEFLQATAQFVGQATQVATTMPEVIPFLMKLMQFGLAGYKSSSEMEGVIDQAIAAVEQSLQKKAQQPPQPSPEEKKLQGEMQMAQMEFQQKTQESQQAAQLDMQKQQFEMQIKREEFELEKQKMEMELQFKQAELQMKQQELAMRLQMQQAQGQVKLAVEQQKGEIQVAQAETQMQTDAVRAEAEEDRAERGFEQEQKRADVAAKADAKRAAAKPKAKDAP
jgi:hypothetical protein